MNSKTDILHIDYMTVFLLSILGVSDGSSDDTGLTLVLKGVVTCMAYQIPGSPFVYALLNLQQT